MIHIQVYTLYNHYSKLHKLHYLRLFFYAIKQFDCNLNNNFLDQFESMIIVKGIIFVSRLRWKITYLITCIQTSTGWTSLDRHFWIRFAMLMLLWLDALTMWFVSQPVTSRGKQIIKNNLDNKIFANFSLDFFSSNIDMIINNPLFFSKWNTTKK